MKLSIFKVAWIWRWTLIILSTKKIKKYGVSMYLFLLSKCPPHTSKWSKILSLTLGFLSEWFKKNQNYEFKTVNLLIFIRRILIIFFPKSTFWVQKKYRKWYKLGTLWQRYKKNRILRARTNKSRVRDLNGIQKYLFKEKRIFKKFRIICAECIGPVRSSKNML